MTMDFPPRVPPASAARLPESLEGEGLLVGWSLEEDRFRRPIGFTFGDPKKNPKTGWIDPILMEGDGHLVTIAPTGAGKGVGAIVPALLRFPGPIIVVDPKGENYAVTARRRREMGQEVVVIDPFGITTDDGEGTGRFDPLDILDVDTASGVDDAALIAWALLPASLDPRNAYWIGRARQLLCGLVLHVASDLDPGENRLLAVRRLVGEAAAAPQTIAQRMRASRHPEVRQIAETLEIGATETLGGIVSFAQEGIDFIRGPLVQRAIHGSTFRLADVTAGAPLSIYLVVPPSHLESHGRLLRLWISALMTAVLRRRRRPDRSTLFILDEAAQLGPLDQLRQAVTLLRGYGLQTWSFWQDVTQLKHLYPTDWQTMINNCRVVQAFGANNLVAAQDMADLVGFGTGSAVLELGDAEMLLQIAGDEAVVARRPDYRTDPAFAGQFDANPLFDRNRAPLLAPRPAQRWFARAKPPKREGTDAADAALARRILDFLGSA